jgi:hypothetical protein
MSGPYFTLEVHLAERMLKCQFSRFVGSIDGEHITEHALDEHGGDFRVDFIHLFALSIGFWHEEPLIGCFFIWV